MAKMLRIGSLAFALAALAGCGVKNDLEPPQQTVIRQEDGEAEVAFGEDTFADLEDDDNLEGLAPAETARRAPDGGKGFILNGLLN